MFLHAAAIVVRGRAARGWRLQNLGGGCTAAKRVSAKPGRVSGAAAPSSSGATQGGDDNASARATGLKQDNADTRTLQRRARNRDAARRTRMKKMMLLQVWTSRGAPAVGVDVMQTWHRCRGGCALAPHCGVRMCTACMYFMFQVVHSCPGESDCERTCSQPLRCSGRSVACSW